MRRIPLEMMPENVSGTVKLAEGQTSVVVLGKSPAANAKPKFHTISVVQFTHKPFLGLAGLKK